MCLRITYAAVSVLHPDADGVVEVGEVVGVVGGAHVGLVVPALDLARGTGVVLQAPDGGQVPAQSCCKITDKSSRYLDLSSLSGGMLLILILEFSQALKITKTICP